MQTGVWMHILEITTPHSWVFKNKDQRQSTCIGVEANINREKLWKRRGGVQTPREAERGREEGSLRRPICCTPNVKIAPKQKFRQLSEQIVHMYLFLQSFSLSLSLSLCACECAHNSEHTLHILSPWIGGQERRATRCLDAAWNGGTEEEMLAVRRVAWGLRSSFCRS